MLTGVSDEILHSYSNLQKNSIFSDICTQNLELTSARHVPPYQNFFMCYTIRKSENIAKHHM